MGEAVLPAQPPWRLPVNQQVEIDLAVRVQRNDGRRRRRQPRRRQPIGRHPPQLAMPAPCLAPAGQPVQPGRRQQAERPPEEVQVAPSAQDMRLQRDRGADRQHEAAQPQQAGAQPAIAHYAPGTRNALRANQGGAEAAQQQQWRRRGDGEPGRQVLRRRRIGADDLPLEQAVNHRRDMGQHPERLQETERVLPVIGLQGVDRR